MRLGDLILDPNIHPRGGTISEVHIAGLRDAVQAGVELPDLIVCQTTNKLVEGWHRRETYRRIYGDDYDVGVELREYENDQERFADALAMAPGAKLGLTPYDQARCLERGQELGLDPEMIAVSLNVPLEKLIKRVSVASVQRRPMVRVQLKSPMKHMEGRALTPIQVEANQRSDGMPVAYHARQIANRLRSDTVDWGRRGDIEAMVELRELLNAEARLEGAAAA